MSRKRRTLKRTIHVRVPLATAQALEKMARLAAGTRTTPHGAVSQIVRDAIDNVIATALTNSGVQCAPAHSERKEPDDSPDVSSVIAAPISSPSISQAA